jgi:hypothetical protein
MVVREWVKKEMPEILINKIKEGKRFIVSHGLCQKIPSETDTHDQRQEKPGDSVIRNSPAFSGYVEFFSWRVCVHQCVTRRMHSRIRQPSICKAIFIPSAKPGLSKIAPLLGGTAPTGRAAAVLWGRLVLWARIFTCLPPPV